MTKKSEREREREKMKKRANIARNEQLSMHTEIITFEIEKLLPSMY